MAKSLLFCCALGLLVCLVSAGVSADGVITFQVNVDPGLTISSPAQLLFNSVAPEQTDEQDLPLTIWSNVEWELIVQACEQGGGQDLCGSVEVKDERGNWLNVFIKERKLRINQPATGADGIPLSIPFRFTGSYEDAPGAYSFQVEFTVVPAI